MPGLTDNLHLLAPEFALAGLAFLVFTVDLFLPENKKDYLAWLSVAGLENPQWLLLKLVLKLSAETFEGSYGVEPGMPQPSLSNHLPSH